LYEGLHARLYNKALSSRGRYTQVQRPERGGFALANSDMCLAAADAGGFEVSECSGAAGQVSRSNNRVNSCRHLKCSKSGFQNLVNSGACPRPTTQAFAEQPHGHCNAGSGACVQSVPAMGYNRVSASSELACEPFGLTVRGRPQRPWRFPQ
jgi:hypothetical protein